MRDFATMRVPIAPTGVAPDGFDIRTLLALSAGSMAHFELGPGKVTRAVAHRTVEEVWFILSGYGEMWRKQGEREETVALEPGVCLTIPLGTRFQFRASACEALSAIAITMPRWPGDDEAVPVVGPWAPSEQTV
jgi:mannose-6-phosphate isomerase-like protein (cupin superfamily)